MHKTTFVIIILLLVVGIVVVALGDRDGQVVEEAGPTTQVKLEAESNAESSGALKNPAVNRTGVDPASTIDRDVQQPIKSGILVTVSDSTEGGPVPNAEVLVLDNGVTDWIIGGGQEIPPVGGDDLFLLFGARYKTNEAGQALIASPVGTMHIAARTETHFGFEFNVDSEERVLSLSVNPMTIIPVRVVDESGGAVEGVPVSIRLSNGRPTLDIVRAVTGSDGMASLRFSSLVKMEYFGQDLSVAIMALVPSPITKPLDPANLPREPVSLVLPATGQVQIQVNGNGDSSTNRLFIVDVAAVEEPAFQDLDQGVEPASSDSRLVEFTFDGIARFPFVGFDQYLFVSATSQDGEQRLVGHAPGPTEGGGIINISLSSEVQKPILVGRIVNAEGKPAKNLGFETNLRFHLGENGWDEPGQLRTDDEGFFRLPFEDYYEQGCQLTFTIKMRATKRKPKRVAVVDLSRSLGSGEQDLGELVVVVPPLLVQGVVVSKAGDPVPGAWVSFWRGSFPGKKPNELKWRGDWELRTETDSEGQFTIRGFVEDGRLKVSTEHDNYLGGEQDFVEGERNIRIELEKSMILEGRLLLEDEIDSKFLRVTVKQENGNAEHKPKSFSADLGQDGRFQVHGLSEGVATLSLLDENSTEELFSMGSFALSSPGRKVTLDDIDMRGGLFSISVLAIDETRNPLEDAWFRNISRSGPSRYRDLPDAFITRGQGFDIEVGRLGRKSKSLFSVQQSLEVELPIGLAVKLVLENPDCIPAGWELIGALRANATEAEDQGFFRRRSPRGGVFANGVLSLSVSDQGDYQAMFYLRRVRDGFVHSISPKVSHSGNTVGYQILDGVAANEYQIVLLEDSLPDVE